MAYDSPRSNEELYLARGDEVPRARPLFQGDVFKNVPGAAALVAVVSHPCAMRAGPKLLSQLSVVEVASHTSDISPAMWAGNSDRMFFPDLDASGTPGRLAAALDGRRPIATDTLLAGERIACLSQHGVAVLQQRLAGSATRIEVALDRIEAALEPYWFEAELLEDWIESTCSHLEDDPTYEVAVGEESEYFDTLLTVERTMSDDVTGMRRKYKFKEFLNSGDIGKVKQFLGPERKKRALQRKP